MPKIAKRILVVIGAFFGLLVVVAIAVPLFVDVDKYRPQIVKAANENLNGTLELGKLHLSLWGRIKVQVDGFTLSDAAGRKIVAAQDVYFHVPFWPLLTGSPVVTFRLGAPEVHVTKDKAGKMNVLTLVKSSDAKPAPAEPAKPAGDGKLPGIATRARLGIEMRNAHVTYADEATKLTSDVKDLNLLVENLSLSHPIDAKLWANLDTRMGKTLTLKGPAELKAHIEPKFEGGKFQQGSITLSGNMDKVEVLMPDLFHKKPGVPANLSGSVKTTAQEATIEKIVLKFHNAEITTTGTIRGLDATPQLAIKVGSNEIALAPWAELVPMLKSYELGGAAGFDAEATGSAFDPNYRATLSMKAVTAKAPTLKVQPRIDGEVKVAKDKVESLLVTVKAPGNDLKITGNLVSFTKPRASFTVASTGLDIDQLIDMPKGKKAEAAKSGSGGSGTAGGKQEDMDAMVDPLRKNEMVAGAVANIKIQIASLKAQGVKLTDIGGQMNWRDLAFALENFHFNVFGGSLKTSMGVQLKPKTPTYNLNLQVANLDMQQAVASQMELFKNTVTGKANFSMSGHGASFNPEPAKGNLNAKGTMKIDKAEFQSIDVGKMVAEGITKSLDQVAAKIPQLKGVKVPVLKTDSKYEFISSDFTIAGGKFDAPNFIAKAEANKGFDIKGSTNVGMKDYALSANWEVADTYNLTKARDIAVDLGGVKVEHVLAAGNDPVKLPIRVSGTCLAPQYNYGQVPEALTKIAVNNTAKAAETKVKAEVQKKVQDEGKKALQGLGKSLFGK